jgi:hypothetical protein
VTTTIVFSSSSNHPATKPLSGDILECRHRNLLYRLRCLGGQGLPSLSAGYSTMGRVA